MFLGWTDIYVDEQGYPTEEITRWVATGFILFFLVVYVGEMRDIDNG